MENPFGKPKLGQDGPVLLADMSAPPPGYSCHISGLPDMSVPPPGYPYLAANIAHGPGGQSGFNCGSGGQINHGQGGQSGYRHVNTGLESQSIAFRTFLSERLQ